MIGLTPQDSCKKKGDNEGQGRALEPEAWGADAANWFSPLDCCLLEDWEQQLELQEAEMPPSCPAIFPSPGLYQKKNLCFPLHILVCP